MCPSRRCVLAGGVSRSLCGGPACRCNLAVEIRSAGVVPHSAICDLDRFSRYYSCVLSIRATQRRIRSSRSRKVTDHRALHETVMQQSRAQPWRQTSPSRSPSHRCKITHTSDEITAVEIHSWCVWKVASTLKKKKNCKLAVGVSEPSVLISFSLAGRSKFYLLL